MAEIDTIMNLPDISFIDFETLEDYQDKSIAYYLEKLNEIEESEILSLADDDPFKIILYAVAQLEYQIAQSADKAGKMNFLKYAYGDYLDHLGANKKTIRKPAKPAVVAIQFTASAIRQSATPIPAGTMATADGLVFFASTDYAEIPAGESSITMIMECTIAGDDGNGYAAGEITTLSDPVEFIDNIVNVSASYGGADEEDDDSFKERIFLAPSSFSVAGPDDAYIYWAKEADSQVGDVSLPDAPPGVVDIRFILKDGSLPTEEIINTVRENVSKRDKRPTTDMVVVGAPDIVEYGVDIRFYIAKSDTTTAGSIQQQVRDAVADYIKWQNSSIGRDINPDELVYRVRAAGAKRVEITEPVFTPVDDTKKAQFAGTAQIIYGGIEND